MNDSSLSILFSRIDDLAVKSSKGIVANTPFLNLYEQRKLQQYVARAPYENRVFFFGGYDNAERKCAFVLPEYLIGLDDENSISPLFAYCKEEISSVCSAVKIKGSGYKKLSHRDYLGAILNLGIDRAALGDICVLSDFECVVFASQYVVALLLSSCEKIGHDKVKVSIADIDDSFIYERKTKEITDTVASDRLDCVVAALINESRERAKEAVLSGLVELNFEECCRTDKRVENSDVISIRGFGRFVVDKIDTETKKGRLRLRARKYI